MSTRATIKVFEAFPQITAAVEARARAGLEAAAIEAAGVAQESASIDLQVEVIPVVGTVDGYAAGIKSRRTGTSDAHDTTPIARFFDAGTLGKRKRKLSAKTRRKKNWTVTRGGSTYTAERHAITPEMGIKAENFFGKARAAGRRVLIETLAGGL